jgi:hypothetical protein
MSFKQLEYLTFYNTIVYVGVNHCRKKLIIVKLINIHEGPFDLLCISYSSFFGVKELYTPTIMQVVAVPCTHMLC